MPLRRHSPRPASSGWPSRAAGCSPTSWASPVRPTPSGSACVSSKLGLPVPGQRQLSHRTMGDGGNGRGRGARPRPLGQQPVRQQPPAEFRLAGLQLLEVSSASSRRTRASVDGLSSLLSVRLVIGLSANGGLRSRQAALRSGLQKLSFVQSASIAREDGNWQRCVRPATFLALLLLGRSCCQAPPQVYRGPHRALGHLQLRLGQRGQILSADQIANRCCLETGTRCSS